MGDTAPLKKAERSSKDGEKKSKVKKVKIAPNSPGGADYTSLAAMKIDKEVSISSPDSTLSTSIASFSPHSIDSVSSPVARMPVATSSMNNKEAGIPLTFRRTGRWSEKEEVKLHQMRIALGGLLSNRKQLPDVVGDRRLLRFLRGHGFDMEKTCRMFSKFLKWRDDNKVDDIRNDILYGGYRSILEFPSAKKIMSLVPQIIIAHDARDYFGNPIGIESFSFDPVKVLKEISKEEYVKFMTYMLEYKVLVLEQMSNDIEEQTLKQYNGDAPITEKGYGVILQCRIFRDFNGFGVGHIGFEGRTVITWILELAVDNYPELMCRSHMINVPWVFNTIWFFVKGMLDENTIRKITISGSDFLDVVKGEVPMDSIPARIGGRYNGDNKPFIFDLSASGPFYYENDTIGNMYRANLDKVSPVITGPVAPEQTEAMSPSKKDRDKDKDKKKKKKTRRKLTEVEAKMKGEMHCNLVSLQKGKDAEDSNNISHFTYNLYSRMCISIIFLVCFVSYNSCQFVF